MNRSQKKNGACLFFVGFLLLFAGISTANAAENILGDWEFTMDMGDMGGMGGGMNITINSTFTKGDNGITGTWEMAFDMPEGGLRGGMGGPGGGGFQMPTFKIVDVKIDGQNLSFTRKTESDAGGGMGGMMMEDRQFAGTIKGDTIELTSSSNFGEMTYKGTRKAAPQVLEGDWEFKMSMGNMGMEFTIKSTIAKDAEGQYSMTWDQQMTPPEGMEGMGPGAGGFPSPDIKIEDINLEGNTLTFTQKVSFGDMGGRGMGGGEITSNFTGTINGDVIEGKLVSADNGMGMGPMEFILTGQRKAATTAAGLEGDWEFITIVEDMGMEFRNNATFKKAEDGTYAGTWEMVMDNTAAMGPPPGEGPMFDIKIEDIKLEGDKVTFVQKFGMGGDMGMGEMIFNYTGTLKGDKIEGGFSGEMGDSVSNGTRKKVTDAAVDDALVGDWEFKMSMADSGMGMGQMEFTINSTISKDTEGKYSMTWDQVMNQQEGGFGAPTFNVTVEDIKLDGNKLTFVRKVDMGDMGGMGMGGEMVSNFTGTIEEGKINGTVVSDFGEMTLSGSKK